MKIFVINLEKDKERRHSISQQLKNLGLSYEIVTGVYGSVLSDQELSVQYDAGKAKWRLGRSLVPAEIGCALSHLSVYQKMINEGCESALILEDDVTLPENLSCFLDECNEFLDCQTSAVWLLSPAVGHGNIKHFSSGDRLLATYKNGFFTSSYVLTLSAAKALRKELYPVGDVADCWFRMQRYGVVDMFVVTPPLIVQNQEKFGSSTTDDVKATFSLGGLQGVCYKARRLRNIIWDFFYTPYRRWICLINSKGKC